jgi:Domain of unknown function (DUF4198)
MRRWFGILCIGLSLNLVDAAAGSWSHAASASELVIRPDSPVAEKDSELGFSVILSDVFIRGGEFIERRDLRAGRCGPFREIDAQLRRDPKNQGWRGTIRIDREGTIAVCAHLLPQIWINTATGLRRGNRQSPDATDSFVLEEFAKALVNLDPNDTRYAMPIRERLELVPLTNPALVHPGQSLEVLVLHRGEPVAAHVQATYDGFSDKPDTYFEAVDSGTDGTATIKITAPGLWLIRVEYSVPEITNAYQRWVGRAALLLTMR